MFQRNFSVHAAFQEPIDFYILKVQDRLAAYQVSANDMVMHNLLQDASLLEVQDYIRISTKHNFDGIISVDCRDDLVLVDKDVCEISSLPKLIEITSKPEANLCYNEL